jgi:hypothetical protein
VPIALAVCKGVFIARRVPNLIFEHDFRGELCFLLGMQAPRELYGKSYSSLEANGKTAVDQMVLATGNYQATTPELLKAQTAKPPLGFLGPTSPPGTKTDS